METDNTKEAYNLYNYDSVIIIIKDNAKLYEGYKGFLKYDKNRKKYFLSGKLVEDLHPVYHTLSLVLDKNIEAFFKAKKYVDKKKYVLNVLFPHIDYITLQFDSLDWIR